MSIQLYSSPMKYKDPNTGNYTSIIGISGNPGRGIASVELNNDYTLTLTFTDGTSTTTSSIRGNGIESIEKTSTSGLIDTYTITDSDSNTYTFEVTNGDVPNLTIGTVTEGKEASATITGSRENPVLNLVLPLPSLTDYVKKTDYANGTNTGVIRVNNNYGLTNVDASDGGVGRTTYTAIMAPTTTEIRTGADRYKPIVPRNQHEASFYGLAKAAGDTSQAQSSNAVGTYTAGAKAAIQAMLDVPSNAAMQQAIDNINTMKIHICTSEEYDAQTGVPTVQNPDAQTFYLVPAGESSNLFIEWVYVNSAWERFGSADIDLSGYATKADTVLDTTLSRGRKANTTVGTSSFAFGNNVEASGSYSHAEGYGTVASGRRSHAEGYMTTASGSTAYAIGNGTIANGVMMFSAGYKNVETTIYPEWVAGTQYSVGDRVQRAGWGFECIIANNSNTILETEWRKLIAPTESVMVIGNGVDNDHRSNAYALDWDGNGHYMGDVYVGANADSSSGTKVATVDDIAAIEVPVQDVQVNGVSVVDANGVAEIPVATGAILGLVRSAASNGIYISPDSGNLQINKANSDQIKAGTATFHPIVPYNEYEAAFYGLAKAAGDTTQSSSSNAVGTYTSEAKTAIKRMLGVTQTLTITAQTQDGVTVTGQTVTVRADDASGEVYATAAYEGQPVSFSLPSGFQYYVSISDMLAHHFNPTTARGVITNADASVTLQYSDFSSIHTAADIKAALDANINLTDLVGESITCTRGTDTLTWDVADYDATNKRVTLLLHDAFGSANMVFEPAQALMWCENGLAAGNYTFKWNSTQVYFTLATAIPAGGQLRATNSAFSTYESQSATSTLETGTVSIDVISGATDLGTTGSGLLNHHDRVNYGSNNYVESALFWWLNSDAAANTQRVPVTKFSRAYSYNVAGFLNGLDESFVSVIDDAVWKCSTNNVYECPASLGGATSGKQNSYTVTAKIGLASEMEIFGSYGGTADGSTIFDLYNGATADDRKKYRGTIAQTWWLRSPLWITAYYERFVLSSGGTSGSGAHGSYAVVPACQISQSVGD